jgi:hypothetical protein
MRWPREEPLHNYLILNKLRGMSFFMSFQLLRTGPGSGFHIKMPGKQRVEYLLTPMAKPDPKDEKNFTSGKKRLQS